MSETMKRLYLITAFGLLCTHAASGGGGVRESVWKGSTEKTPRMMTGNLAVDLFAESSPWLRQELRPAGSILEDPKTGEDRKSLLLAAALSAAVPGAGEFYSKSYVKSGVFFAAELISWYVNISYNRKGDRATDDFQNFADIYWSVVRYGQFAEALAPSGGDFKWRISGQENRPPWEQVNWSELNRMERAIGGFFSHTLPPHGDQQYYELIGKYPQYNPGWSDASGPISEENISQLFKKYSGMRGHANDFYNTASTALLVVVVNHILSAADAAWSASRYNAVHTELGMKMQRTPFGVEMVPTATVQVRW